MKPSRADQHCRAGFIRAGNVPYRRGEKASDRLARQRRFEVCVAFHNARHADRIMREVGR